MEDPVEDAEQEGALSDLIDVERRVLETIHAAEAEAERAIAEVEAELDVDACAGDHALEVALREFRAELEAQRAEALAEIERRSATAARRYHDVDETRVEALAAYVARRIAEDDLEAAPGDEASRGALPIRDRTDERPS